METFEVEGCHHVYHTVWSPTVRERRLDCAVAVMRSSAIVGRTSLTLSLTACSSFPEREESPMSRSLGSIQQLSLYWYSVATLRT